MAQTSIEWLQQSMEIHLSHEQKMQYEGLYQQAKEMHKAEIEEAYNHRNITTLLGRLLTSENYYNETFK